MKPTTHILIALLLSTASSLLSAPPHIVVFISDDMGRAESSVYGSPDCLTPTMEMLAKKGMTFENAYVASPSCCPNRSSLITGLMPARHGAHPNHTPIKPGIARLLPLLDKAGYTIASFGKVAHGRERMEGTDFFSPKPVDLALQVSEWFSKNPVEGPVCLLVGDRRPHVPWIEIPSYDPDKVHLPPYLIDTPETREHWARYLTDTTDMDAEMEKVHELAKTYLGDDFLFLFTSDHGGQWARGKWNLYETGVRVPLFVSWPDHIKAGVRTDAFVSWVDLLPTLLDIAGVTLPDGLDGQSFAPVLLGESDTHRDKIFTTHTGDGAMNVFPIRGVRIGDFKLIHNLRPDAYFTNHSDRHRLDGAGAYWDSWDEKAKTDPAAAALIKAYYTREEFELFDLSKDPAETNNLADNPEYQEKLKQLQAELDAWTTSQGDDLQPHREIYPVSSPLPDLPPPKKKAKKKETKP